MRPPSSTVGVNFRPTPKDSSCSVKVPKPPAPPCATGMKTLPPARKLPSWPLMAIRFGSASSLTRPSCFSASTVIELLLASLRISSTPAPPALKSLAMLYVKLPEVLAARHADTELVGQGLGDLGHLDLEQHLLRRDDAEQIDHAHALLADDRGPGTAGTARPHAGALLADRRAHVGVGQLHGLLDLGRVADAAAQHQRIGRRRDLQTLFGRAAIRPAWRAMRRRPSRP